MTYRTECIKTGAKVYIEQYGAVVITDLFRTGNCYHFKVLSDDHINYVHSPALKNLVVHHTQMSLRAGDYIVVPVVDCGEFTYD